MKRLTYIIMLSLSLSLFYSCDNNLEIEPANKYTINSVIFDKESAEKVLNGVRGKVNQTFIYTKPLVGMGDCMRAGYMYEFSSNIPATLNFTSNNVDIRLWTYHNEIVALANAFLDGMAQVDNIPAEDKERLVAEGKFLRGFANWRLLMYFGIYWDIESPDGILIKTSSPNLNDEDWPRSSVKESYVQILKDMEDVDKIQEFRHARFMNRTAARVIKAQVYLNRGIDDDYQKAYKIIDEVLPDGDVEAMAHLVEKHNYEQMFLDLWDNPEALFASYIEEKNRRSFSMIDYYVGTAALSFVSESAIGLWPECLDADGELVDLSTMEDVRMNTTMGTKDRYNRDTYTRYGKFTYKKGMDITDGIAVDCTPYLRWSEVYLMKAELKIRTGQSIAEALVPVNKIRERCGASVFPAPATIDDFNLLLYEEYARELLGEAGQEYWAGIRIKVNGKMARETYKKCVNLQNREYEYLNLEEKEWFKLVYPIPAQEFDYNKECHQTDGHI